MGKLNRLQGGILDVRMIIFAVCEICGRRHVTNCSHLNPLKPSEYCFLPFALTLVTTLSHALYFGHSKEVISLNSGNWLLIVVEKKCF
jgi:hypothetical protein